MCYGEKLSREAYRGNTRGGSVADFNTEVRGQRRVLVISHFSYSDLFFTLHSTFLYCAPGK